MVQKRGVCNLCEAICGLLLTVEDTPDGQRVTDVRGDPDDPLSRGHICPKGVALPDLHEDPDRLRRPVRRTADGWREVGWDEALDLVATRLAAAVNDHGRDALGHLPRQPQCAQPRLADARHRAGEVVPHPQQVQRDLRRPAARAAAGLPDARPPAAAAGPRPRPHPALPGRRGQPDGLERVADDGPRLPGPAARAQAPRWPDGRRGPAPHRDRAGRDRAPLRPARRRRVRAAGDGPGAARRGARHSPGVRRRARRGARGGAAVHARARRGGRRHPGRRRPDPGARPGGGAERGRLRTGRRLHAAVRAGGDLGGAAAQPAHRQPRPTGRRDAHETRDRRRRPPDRGPRPPRRVALAGPRPAGVRRRAPGLDAGRRDPHPGRGPGPGRAHAGRQPGLLDARRPPAGGCARRAGLHGGRGHLRQRDHPARRRDPAADDRAGARPLRPGVPRAGRAQHRPVHARGARQVRRRDARLGDLPRDRAPHPAAAARPAAAEGPTGAGGADAGLPDPDRRRAAAHRPVPALGAPAAPRLRRPRPARALPARAADDPDEAHRRRAAAGGRGPGPARRGGRPGRPAAGRPAAPARQQLLDAQHAPADQGASPPPAPDAPRGPRVPVDRRRGRRTRRVGGGRRRGRGAGQRRHDARRGEPAPRLRSPPRRRTPRARRRAARRVDERPHRPLGARRLRQRRALRRPGDRLRRPVPRLRCRRSRSDLWVTFRLRCRMSRGDLWVTFRLRCRMSRGDLWVT